MRPTDCLLARLDGWVGLGCVVFVWLGCVGLGGLGETLGPWVRG